MPNEFPEADPNIWATYNATFEAGVTKSLVEDEKVSIANEILSQVKPGLGKDASWAEVEALAQYQLKIELTDADGNKVTRGVVRPPAPTRPPASKVSVASANVLLDPEPTPEPNP